MSTIINIVGPAFGIILVGFLSGRFDFLGKDAAAALNRFVFYFALPPALFVVTARAPVELIFNWPFALVFTGAALVTLLVAVIFGRLWFGHAFESLTVVGLSAAFGNVFTMGLPLLLTAFGPDGALPAIVASLINTFVFIAGGVATLEMARAAQGSRLRVLARSFVTVFRNPLVISPLLGMAMAAFAVPLPKAVGNFLDLMAAPVAPVTLFCLGLSLIGRSVQGNWREILWLAGLKNMLNPLLTCLLVTYVLPLDPLWSKAVILLSAMPIGTNPYIIAQQYDVQVQTVSSAVVVSTALSVMTVSGLMIWLGVG
ncbi:MAG: AEC family transporter [Bradyrhizobium sp.]